MVIHKKYKNILLNNFFCRESGKIQLLGRLLKISLYSERNINIIAFLTNLTQIRLKMSWEDILTHFLMITRAKKTKKGADFLLPPRISKLKKVFYLQYLIFWKLPISEYVFINEIYSVSSVQVRSSKVGQVGSGHVCHVRSVYFGLVKWVQVWSGRSGGAR